MLRSSSRQMRDGCKKSVSVDVSQNQASITARAQFAQEGATGVGDVGSEASILGGVTFIFDSVFCICISVFSVAVMVSLGAMSPVIGSLGAMSPVIDSLGAMSPVIGSLGAMSPKPRFSQESRFMRLWSMRQPMYAMD